MRACALLLLCVTVAFAHFDESYLKGTFVFHGRSDIVAAAIGNPNVSNEMVGTIFGTAELNGDGTGTMSLVGVSISWIQDVCAKDIPEKMAALQSRDSFSQLHTNLDVEYHVEHDGSGKMYLLDGGENFFSVHFRMASKDHVIWISDADNEARSWSLGEMWKQTNNEIFLEHPYVFNYKTYGVDLPELVANGYVVFHEAGRCTGYVVRDGSEGKELDNFEGCVYKMVDGSAFFFTGYDVKGVVNAFFATPVDFERTTLVSFDEDNIVGEMFIQTTASSKSSDSSVSTFYSSSESSYFD